MRLAVPIVLLAGAVLTGCRASRVDIPTDITASSDQEWLVPAATLETRARAQVKLRPAPAADAAPLPAYALPGAGTAYRFPRNNLVKRVLETPTGRYLAEVARHQLGAELDPSNPLPDRRMILMPAYDGDRLSFIL
ncbi:MAG: hypothetical protein ACYTF8_14660, partial [Planctomycetota bacterium]